MTSSLTLRARIFADASASAGLAHGGWLDSCAKAAQVSRDIPIVVDRKGVRLRIRDNSSHVYLTFPVHLALAFKAQPVTIDNEKMVGLDEVFRWHIESSTFDKVA
jgi:hypothetical protein